MALDSLPFVRWITTRGAANHRPAPNTMFKIELNGALITVSRVWILSATSRAKFRAHAENYAIPNDKRDCLSKE
jgi:hypothetical protein